MRLGWLSAWWRQLRGRTWSDPWNNDPEIIRERDRQNVEGITDIVTARRLQEELRQRRIDTQIESWRRSHEH